MTEILYTFAGHPDLLVQATYKKLGNPSDEKDMINCKKTKSKRSTNSTPFLTTAVAMNKS